MKKITTAFLALAALGGWLFAADAATTDATKAAATTAEAPAPEAPKSIQALPPRFGDNNGMPGMPAGHGPQQRNPKEMEQRMRQALQEQATKLLQMYDANQNGKLDPEEKSKMDAELAIAAKLQRLVRVSEVIKEVDANHDLIISDEEAVNIRTVMQKMRQAQGPRPGMMNRPGMGPGQKPQDQQGGPHLPPAPPAEPAATAPATETK